MQVFGVCVFRGCTRVFVAFCWRHHQDTEFHEVSDMSHAEKKISKHTSSRCLTKGSEQSMRVVFKDGVYLAVLSNVHPGKLVKLTAENGRSPACCRKFIFHPPP